MPKTAERAADRKCCNCGSSCESKSKPISPVSVTPYDDPNARPELWCPRCFVWKRMHLEPERFNASSTLAVRCQFCGGESVCFSVDNHARAFCACCGAPGAMAIQPSKEDMEAAFNVVRDVAEDKGILRDARK